MIQYTQRKWQVKYYEIAEPGFYLIFMLYLFLWNDACYEFLIPINHNFQLELSLENSKFKQKTSRNSLNMKFHSNAT